MASSKRVFSLCWHSSSFHIHILSFHSTACGHKFLNYVLRKQHSMEISVLSLKNSLDRNNNKPSCVYMYVHNYIDIRNDIYRPVSKRSSKEREKRRRAIKIKRFTADHLHISKKSMFHKKPFLRTIQNILYKGIFCCSFHSISCL